MKSVNIAKFKSELSKYLGYTRHGEEVIIFDRSIPIARVIPFQPKEAQLVFENAIDDPKNLINMHYEPIQNIQINSLKFLLEERGDK